MSSKQPEVVGNVVEGEEMAEATLYEELNDILERILDAPKMSWNEKAEMVLTNVADDVLSEFLAWFEADEEGQPQVVDDSTE
jgi:hypothetical protein